MGVEWDDLGNKDHIWLNTYVHKGKRWFQFDIIIDIHYKLGSSGKTHFFAASKIGLQCARDILRVCLVMLDLGYGRLEKSLDTSLAWIFRPSD